MLVDEILVNTILSNDDSHGVRIEDKTSTIAHFRELIDREDDNVLLALLRQFDSYNFIMLLNI